MTRLEQTIKYLKEDTNNAVSFVYEKHIITKGELEEKLFTIKDNFATSDAPTQGSSLLLKGFQPKYDATVVSKIKKAAGIIVGKTHLDELALGGDGLHSAYGIVKNPIDPTRIIGGSSSGALATMNKKYIDVAIGSDTGDSIRYPASNVGAVGFKPSYGVVSRYGLFAFSSSLDTVAWATHDVQTSIDVADILYDKDEMDMTSKDINFKSSNVKLEKPKKVAFISCDNKVAPYVEKEFENLKSTFTKDGIDVEYVKIDSDLFESIDIVYSIISYAESASNNSNLNGIAYGNRQEGKDWSEIMTNTRNDGFGRMVKRRFTLGSFFLENTNQEKYFNHAKKIRRLIVNEFNSIRDKFDLLIYPTVPSIPQKINEPKMITPMSNVLINANFAGAPSITIPWTNHDGLPVGISLEKNIYQDEKLLSYSLYIEKLLKVKND